MTNRDRDDALVGLAENLESLKLAAIKNIEYMEAIKSTDMTDRSEKIRNIRHPKHWDIIFNSKLKNKVSDSRSFHSYIFAAIREKMLRDGIEIDEI